MSKLKKCKHCGKDVAKSAKSCPSCGGKLGSSILIKLIIGVVIIIAIIVGCSKMCDKAAKEVINEYNDINGKTSFKVGGTFENKHLKINFESFDTNYKKYNEYLGPKDGYKIVQFKLKATNVGEDDEEISFMDFDCYADNIAVDQYLYADDGDDGSSTLSSGKSAIQYVYCQVPKDAKKVTIEYKALFSLADKHIEFIGQE